MPDAGAVDDPVHEIEQGADADCVKEGPLAFDQFTGIQVTPPHPGPYAAAASAGER